MFTSFQFNELNAIHFFRGWVTGWVGQSGVLTPRGATAVAPTQAPRAPNLICDLGVNKTDKIPIRQILSSLV